MAPLGNYLSANIQVVSSSASSPLSLPLMKRITAIKYFSSLTSSSGNINSSAAILAGSGSSTGAQLWFENSTSGHVSDLLSIYDPDGVTVSIGGGVALWIYGTVSRGV